ncbi:MAG: tetratricopeptide repeat protein [Candidatus Obscuribacterales bacterium]|nr:tetratricopeptide repeat protein [Candidatus Obscuribacterales bacterium]
MSSKRLISFSGPVKARLGLFLAVSFLLSGANVSVAAPAKAPSGAKVIPRVQTSAPIGDKWAVVIGVGKFADPQVPQLKYASKDAKDFYDYLVDPNQGKFAKDHVKLLLNEDATKVNIMDMLGDSFLPHAANPNDLVVIYLSTHGSPAGADIRGVNYVVSYDTQLRKLFATGLEMRQLLRIIKERVHTNRILLVLDTCYSGAGGESHKGLSRTNVDSSALAQGIGSLVISSSSPNQRSWESDELKNSYFTRYLIDSLKQASPNTTIDVVFNAMKNRVQQNVLKDKGEVQTPVLSGSFFGPPLVLSTSPSELRTAPVTFALSGDGGKAGKGSAADLSTYGEKMRSARALIDANKLWDASHELEAAIKSNPESVEARLVSSDVYDAQGRFNEAYESAKKAVMNDEESSQAREKLSRAYIRLNNPDEAMRQAQKAVTLDPENSMGYYLMAYINEKCLNRQDQAEQLYRKALELNSLNGKAYMGMASLLSKQGKDDVCEALVRKALEADADDPEAHLALARLVGKKGDSKKAESDLRQAISADPSNPVLHAELGNALSLHDDKATEAEAEYKKALELGPNVGFCHLAFAKFLYDKRDRVEEAEKEFRQAIKLDSSLDEAHVRLADLLVLRKKVYDQADDHYKKALAANPKNALALLGLARIKAELYQDYTGAESELKKALVIDPNLKLAYNMLGLLYQKNLNRYVEAKQSYEKALQIDSKYAASHYNLAMLLLSRSTDKGNENAPLAALDHLKKAADAEPKNSLYRTKMGYVQQQYFKKYKEADAEYRKAIDLNLADAEAHYRLGMLLIEKFGQRRGGEQELRTAFEQDSNDADIKAAYERFVH